MIYNGNIKKAERRKEKIMWRVFMKVFMTIVNIMFNILAIVMWMAIAILVIGIALAGLLAR
jgi:hypothetical protein